MARSITPRSLIVGVFRLIGVTAQNEDPTSAELLEAFDRLNELIDAWSTQRLTMRVTTRAEYALVAGQGSYLIGPLGSLPAPDWVGPRPDFVESVALLLTSSTPETEIPMSELTEAAYQAIAQKDLANSQPTLWRYEPTMPCGTFTVWPIPDTSANPLIVYAAEALQQFVGLTTTYILAPGYTRALRYNLAKELATEYGRQLPPDIASAAAESLSDIKRLNTSMVDLGMDSGLLPVSGRYSYNVNTDC
jgi:hypothetical protein